MLVTQEVKNLIAGVSQQPPLARHPEQLEEQINGLSNETGGLQKRPPTAFMSFLKGSIPEDAKVHFVKRDKDTKYMIIHTGSEILAYDKDGKQLKVNYKGNGVKDYLKASSPRNEIKLVTVADYTFLLNTSVKTRMSSTKTPDVWKSQGLLVHVREGQYGRNYAVKINGKKAGSFETPDGSKPEDAREIDTNSIRTSLFLSLAGNGYNVESQGNSWLYVKAKEPIKSFEVEDGFNGEALKAYHTNVKDFKYLPETAPVGFTVLVRGEKETDDDYYLEYSGEYGWIETTKPGLANNIEVSTMPLGLVYNHDGTLDVKPLEWEPRTTGDEESNEEPSFIGQAISDIFFYRNRLGVTSGENVNLSRSGDYFNFWMESATDLLDTDPIDLQVSHTSVSNIVHAVPYNSDLFLFSNSTQFALSAQGVLTPKNAVIKQVAEYEADTEVRPVGVGRNLYYTTKRLDYTSVGEYFVVQDEREAKDSTNITAHVPNYILNGVYHLFSNSNENIIGVLSSGAPDTIYVYKYLYINGNKVQSAWSKWTFGGKIIGAEFDGSTLYMVIKRGNATVLEKIYVVYNTKEFKKEPTRLLVDSKSEVVLRGGSYDTKRRIYTYKAPEYLTGSKVLVMEDGRLFTTTGDTFKCFTATTLEGKTAYIGEPYEFKAVLTQIFLKRRQENTTQPIPNYRLQLRRLKIPYSDSGEFEVEMEYKGKPSRTYKMTGRHVGDTKIGEHPIQTGEFKAPIQGKNTEVRITIKNGSPLPCGLLGFTWEGVATFRHRSI